MEHFWNLFTGAAMLSLCLLYSYQSHKSMSVIRESHYVRHICELRNVFLLFGVTQFITTLVLLSVVESQWPVICLRVMNMVLCVRLIHSKTHVLAIQRHMNGDIAIEQIEDLSTVIRDTHYADIASRLERITEIIQHSR